MLKSLLKPLTDERDEDRERSESSTPLSMPESTRNGDG